MGKIEKYNPGSFCWAELATSDTKSAKSFYTAMFGWTVIEHAMPEGVYTIFQSDGNDAAAMTPAQPGVPPHWGVYFAVKDADESAAKVRELGGTIIAGPFDVMDIGRMAVAQDPQGGVFSIWQAMRHIGATHGGPLNQVTWPELWTADPAGSVAFYSKLFGWKTSPESGFADAHYIEWINGEAHIGGVFPMRGPDFKGVPTNWTVYITVADCDERTAKAQQLGAKVCKPPADIPNVGRFSVISDAQGAVLSLIQMSERPKPATA